MDSSTSLELDDCLSAFSSAIRIPDQTKYLRQVGDKLKAVEDEDVRKKVCKLLSQHYYQSDQKSSMKRAIASCMQNQPEDIRAVCSELLSSTLAAHFEQFSQDPQLCTVVAGACHVLTLPEEEYDAAEGTKDCDMTETDTVLKDVDRRGTVDVINGLLENFPVGENCLKEIWQKVLSFLQATLLKFQMENCTSSSEVERARRMHDCHVTTQVLNKVLQKTADVIDPQSCRPLFTKLMESVCKPLEEEHNLLDWRSASAISAILIMKMVEGQEFLIMLLTSVFPQHTPADFASMAFPSPLSQSMAGLSCLSVPSSSLCVLHAILAVLSPSQLSSQYCWGSSLLTDILPTELIQIADRIVEGSGKLMASRTLLILTGKAKECVKAVPAEERKENFVCQRFHGEAAVPQAMLHYAWNHWEDAVDAIRYQAQQIFDNVMQCHLEATAQGEAVSAEDDQFLTSTVTCLMEMPWESRAKYRPLVSMVGLLGAAYFLRREPTLPDTMLSVISDQTLACYVSELYDVMLGSHLVELSGTVKGLWQETWLFPVLQLMCKNNTSLHRKHCIEYIIPKILKRSPDSLQYMTQYLADENTGSVSLRLGALVTCLKRSKILGGLLHAGTKTSGETAGMWNNAVPIAVLKRALCHTDEQIRLDAFGLLCEHNKTTAVITEQDFDLIRFFLEHNLDSQTPAFRQYLTSQLKKLFVRLRDGGQTLLKLYTTSHKQKKVTTETLSHLNRYKAFQEWLLVHLIRHLHCGASFPHRTTAVSSLAMMLHILGSTPTNDPQGLLFSLSSSMTPSRVYSLIEALTDTFEHNKTDAYTVLTALPHEKMEDVDLVSQLLESGLTLATSTRPQDGTTAAYLLRLLAKLPALHNVLQTKYHGDIMTCNSNKAAGDAGTVTNVENTESGRCLLLLMLLLKEVKEEVGTAQANLLHASATKPMYPALHVIRYVLGDVNLSSLTSNRQWRRLVAELITTTFTVAEVVSPVVNHSSPEGNVPEEAMTGFQDAEEGEPEVTLDSKTEEASNNDEAELAAGKVRQMPEYLVVCCWRSIKEVSLLLGELMARAPIAAPGGGEKEGLMDAAQLHAVADYFKRQLLESRHRGAFELAYAGFVKMADMLWRSPVPSFECLPGEWLAAILNDIEGDDGTTNLCATRRSAGLPFYMQALVSTEPGTVGRTHFQSVMKRLLLLAHQQDKEEAQVHALNVLRALFRDTRLAEDVSPYIADAMMAALTGYASQLWPIRNSSSLLFSALMTRIFGVQRAKEEVLKKNCLTGRVFFNRFPSLFDFLLEQLKVSTENIDGSQSGGVSLLQPGLYPVLMLLGRLLPSVLQGPDNTYNLHHFLPHVIRCGGSAVHKTRMMAARALSPLVVKHCTKDVLMQLVEKLPQKSTDHYKQNALHGTLLQIYCLLEDDLPVSVIDEIVNEVTPKLLLCQWIATRENRCIPTRLAYMQAANQLLSYTQTIQSDVSAQLSNLLEQVAESELCNRMDGVLIKSLNARTEVIQQKIQDISLSLSCDPCADEFSQALSGMYLTILIQHAQRKQLNCITTNDKLRDGIALLLQSPLYEVRLRVLEILLCLVAGKDGNEEQKDGERSKELWEWLLSEESGVFKELLTMANGGESHAECLAQVLCLLTHFSSNSYSLLSESEHLDFCKRLLQLGEHPMLEIQSEALGVAGTVLRLLQDTEQVVLPRLVDWIEKCSYNECPVAHRLQAASVITNNAVMLLTHQPQSLIDPALMWSSVMRLLQDEDVAVRTQAAKIPAQLPGLQQQQRNELLPESIVPSVALHMCLGGLTSILPVLLAFNIMLQWIQQDLEPDCMEKEKDVRLFDKGEMNSYRDELHFVSIVSHHLSIAAAAQQPLGNIFEDGKLEQVFHEALDFEGEGKDTNCSEPTATDMKYTFTNQTEYQRQVCTLGRHISLCKVVMSVPGFSEEMKEQYRVKVSQIGKLFTFQSMYVKELLEE